MLVGVDVVLTFGFLGFVFAVVLLLCLFAIISKLSGIQTALRGILAHQRFANAWPVKEHGRWTVLTETFNTEAEAKAFIDRHQRQAPAIQPKPAEPAPREPARAADKRHNTNWQVPLPPGYVDR